MSEEVSREFHKVIVVGAGPGGLSVAAALSSAGIRDVLVLEKGIVGQAWLDYPEDTRLLSSSRFDNDENMIADIPLAKLFPHVEHPSHVTYQRYLEYVATTKALRIREHQQVDRVVYDAAQQKFVLCMNDDVQYAATYVVWATGIFSKPKEDLDAEGCYIHYARLPYIDALPYHEVTVVGSANGASGVVMSVAKMGRVVTLVTSRPYEIPEPVDCLWKEHMVFVKDLEKQGLVKIIENFRVKRIYHQDTHYVLEGSEGQKLSSKHKPIICTGFSANVDPVRDLISEVCREHEEFIDVDASHQSSRQAGLYIAGTIGKTDHDQGFIKQYREFGTAIAHSIKNAEEAATKISKKAT